MPKIRQAILEILGRQNSLTVQDIAQATHLTVMATRYHLGILARADLVVARQIPGRGRVGRPHLVYSLTEAAHTALPQQYEWLATQVLAELKSALGAGETRTLLRRAGRRMAAQAGAMPASEACGPRVRRVARWLAEHGYMASTEKGDRCWTLVICNCPFRSAAARHPELCEMDRACIASLLNEPVRLTQCIAGAGSQCRFDLNARPRSRVRLAT